MSTTILKVENISKQYRLGKIGTGTLSHDLNRWWHTVRGKEDPYLKIGESNDRSTKGDSQYVWALQDINFEVKQGEVLGIIGKNGAGKSTLLKILSRVTAPTTGTIKTRGRIASLLEVGTGFHPEMTGRENIYLNGAILGMTKKEIASKIDEIIAFSGCERYIDTPTKRYSSGMTVRLAFAVAAHLEPEILVVDEVLAVGDAEFQKKAIGKMQDISKGEGRTVLFVSHNMAAVKSLCTRGLVLENGRVVFDGGVEESIDAYIMRNKSLEKNKEYYENFVEESLIKMVKVEEKLIISGGSLTINLMVNYQSKSNIHIGIYNFTDEKIFHISSEYFNDNYLLNKNNFKCKISKLTLTQGNYYVNIGLVSENIVIEEIKRCIEFEVLNGDFYKTGFMVKSASLKSKILVDYEWI